MPEARVWEWPKEPESTAVLVDRHGRRWASRSYERGVGPLWRPTSGFNVLLNFGELLRAHGPIVEEVPDAAL